MKTRSRVVMVLIGMIVLLSACGAKSDKDYYEEGQAYLKESEYKKAESSFTQAIKQNAKRAEYYLGLGTAQLQLGKYDKAKKNFSYVIRDKNNQIMLENNKRAYRGLGIVYYCQGEYKKASEQFDLALAISELPELTEDVLQYCATSHERSQDTDRALECYNRLIEEFGGKAKHYEQRAAFYASAGYTDKALADYQQARKKDKEDPNIMLGLYSIYRSKGEEGLAEEILNDLLAMKTDTPDRKYCHAIAQYYANNLIDALNELTTLAKGGQLEANYYIAQIYQQDKDYKKALKYYQLYLDAVSGGETADLANQMGGCYTELEDYKTALEYYLRALSMNPGVLKQTIWRNVILGMEHTAEYDTAYDQAMEYQKAYPQDQDMKQELVYITTRLSRKKAKIVEAENKAAESGVGMDESDSVSDGAVTTVEE